MDHQLTKPSSIAIRFSTDAFPERHRATMWRERVMSQFVRFDYAPLTKNVRLDAVGMTLPSLGVVLSELTPVRCARTRETMLDGNDNIRLVILKQSESPALAAHLGREITVGSGHAVVLSNSDLNAITFTSSKSRILALNLTRKILRPLLRDFDAALAQTIPNQIGALRFLVSYIEALLAEPAPPTAGLQQLAVAHIYDLAALAMGATRDTAEIANNRGLRAARLREIKSSIIENLWRENLSIKDIATWQRVTPRYIQLLFEDDGTTFTKFVLDARLDRARRMLVDPNLAYHNISAIALDAGFGDLSYFNRVFRRRFGGTPSDIRAAGTRQE